MTQQSYSLERIKVKSISKILTTAAAAMVLATGCNETGTVGNVLEQESLVIVIDSAFTVTGTSEANPVVQSRTLSQLLGRISADRYGTISSDIVAQFMPSTTIDTVSVTAADMDSIKLYMQMKNDAFVGDSLVPMGLEVYRLTRELPYPIYSDFDPAGYYDPTPIGSTVYTASNYNEPDTVKKYGIKAAVVDLPRQMAVDLYQGYVDDPTAYSYPEVFADKVFRGLYIKSNYGSGRISDFTTTSLRLYYHKTTYNTDSARYERHDYVGDYFAVTPEMVVNNNIRYTPARELVSMVEAGDHIMAAPAGYQVEIKFPAREVVASYNRYAKDTRVLNSLTFDIPADSIGNSYNIAPPPYAMLILKRDLNKFYESNTVPDQITGFYTGYSYKTGSYTFISMRGYLEYLLGLDEITEDDLTFLLCPVQLNTEEAANSNNYYGTSQTIVTSVVPYVSKPAMARISLKDAKIKLTFSAETGKNF